jgi:hypothetical protein
MFVNWFKILFAAALLLSLLASAVDPPLGALGIKKDLSIEGAHHYHSKVTYKDVVTDISTLDDNTLSALARDAYLEMVALYPYYDPPIQPNQKPQNYEDGKEARQPSVMTALALGRDIYFSSSIKGGKWWIYKINAEGSPGAQMTLNILKECASKTQPSHRTGGSCGEVMAISRWYQDGNLNNDIKDQQNGRIVTWGRLFTSPDLATDTMNVKAPCGTPDKWGCSTFVSETGLRSLTAQIGASQSSAWDEWRGTEYICLVNP